MKLVIETEGLMLAFAAQMKKVQKELGFDLVYGHRDATPAVAGIKLTPEQTDRALELMAIGAIRACFASCDSLHIPVPVDEIGPHLVSVPLPEEPR